MNKTNKKIKKGKLPNGWYVLPSKSYPHLVYYYNVLSNTSTWECPVTLPSSSDEDSEDESLEDSRDRRVTSSNVNDDFYPKTPARTFGSTSASDDEYHPPVSNKNSTGNFSTFLLPNNSSDKDKNIGPNIYHKKAPLEKEKNIQIKNVSKSSKNNNVNDKNIGSKVKCNGIPTNLINTESKMDEYFSSTTKTVPSDTKNDLLKSNYIKKSIWQKKTVRLKSENARVILKRGTNMNNATDGQNQGKLVPVLDKGQKPVNSFTVKDSSHNVQDRQEGTFQKNLAENRMKALKRSLDERNKRPNSSPSVGIQSTIGSCSVTSNDTNNTETAMKKLLTAKESERIEASPDTQSDTFADGKSCQRTTLENDSDEEMEWENIEVDILMDVQELRDQIQQAGGININDVEEIKFEKNVNTQSNKPALFAVIDTNILLAYLNFLEEFRDTNIKGFGYPVLVIPWMVLQELDILKDRRGATKSPVTASRARRAIKFLHSNFHSHHPRVIGQTLPAVGSQFELLMKLCPDDSVLECCIQYKSVDKSVILISNDVNLCNKAEVHGINAYSKDELGNVIQKMKHDSSNGYQSSKLGNTNPIALTNTAKSINNDIDSSFVDTLFCNLKKTLQDVFGKILQMETEKIYGDKWIDVIHIKPPWTLPDILSCLVSHWIAVFCFIMPKHCFMLLKDLKSYFNSESQEKGYDHSLDKVECIIDHSIRIFQEISDPQYKTLVTDGEQNLRRLQHTCKTKEKCTKYKDDSVVGSPIQEEPSILMECSAEDNMNDGSLNNVQMLLKHSWNTIHTLCNNIQMMLKSNEKPGNFPPEKNVETLISYFYPIIEQFCYFGERIIKEDLSLLSIEHEAIQGIYMTLDKCNQTRSDLNLNLNDLLLFLRTDTARTMLVCAVNDFQKFSEIMRQGVDYFVSKDEASRRVDSMRKL